MKNEHEGMPNNWAAKESKALDMTIDKMMSIGAMNDDYTPVKNSKLTQQQVTDMFKSYLEHFKQVCHKRNLYESKPTNIGDILNKIR